MEIPCHKSKAVWSKSTPNSMTIPCHLSRFYLFSMLEHDMDFGQVQVMEFPWHLLRKWWDFHRIWSHFRTKPNCRGKDMRKSLTHFLQGGSLFLAYLRTKTEANIIVADWYRHSLEPIYWNSVTHVVEVGQYLGTFIDYIRVNAYYTNMTRIHMIGN